MKKKVFISGKISGEPILDCFNKFEKAEKELLGKDFEVVNPLKIKGMTFGIEWIDAMWLCADELATCTHIYMLSDWKNSKGANI